MKLTIRLPRYHKPNADGYPRAATTTIIPYAAHSLFSCELLIEEARRWVDSDAESTLDEDEEYEHEDEGGNQYQPSADLPIHFLWGYIDIEL